MAVNMARDAAGRIHVDGNRLQLTRTVDDIDAAYEELKSKGVDFLEGPHLIFRDDQGMFGDAGEEEWMAFFSDPSGNTLALATRKRS